VDYHVFARKYRPQTFADVAGQEVVARTLTNAIAAGKVHHAWLFTGPRGVGKTSMARILAKALTCENGPTITPCGVCQHCRMIADSSHPDVAEIDAARFTGVDAIRELAENTAFSPTLARLRIYILDEVHMLSNSAWNALLKVLEEPPAHVKFIFATTEVDKVLPTVLSRVQRFDFRSIDLETTVARLKLICEREHQPLDDGVLLRIARAAGGGMRDAQTLLDQLLAVGGGGDDLDLLLGAARGGEVHALLAEVCAGKAKEALERLGAILGQGVAPATLIDQLVERVRGVLLTQACGVDSPVVRRLGGNPTELAVLAKELTPEKVLRLAQTLLAGQQALRHGVDPRLQLELVLVRIANLGQVLDVEGVLRRLERLETTRNP